MNEFTQLDGLERVCGDFGDFISLVILCSILSKHFLLACHSYGSIVIEPGYEASHMGELIVRTIDNK